MLSSRSSLLGSRRPTFLMLRQKAFQVLLEGLHGIVDMPEAHHASAVPPHILGGIHVYREVYTGSYHLTIISRDKSDNPLLVLLHFLLLLLGSWNSSTELEVASSRERYTVPCGHPPSLAPLVSQYAQVLMLGSAFFLSIQSRLLASNLVLSICSNKESKNLPMYASSVWFIIYV
jgi:hypothetical protein